MALTDTQIQAALAHLQVGPADFQQVSALPTFEARCQGLEDLKGRIRKNFKKAALELHPDRTGDDPGKTEIFKVLAQFVDQVDQLRVRQPQPPVRFQIISSTATWTSSGWPGTIRVVW
jgi:hypothetical protein